MTGTRRTARARRAAAVVLLVVLLGGLLGAMVAAGTEPGARTVSGVHLVKSFGKAVVGAPLRGDDGAGGSGWPVAALPVLLLIAAAGLVALAVAATARSSRLRRRTSVASRAPPVRPAFAR